MFRVAAHHIGNFFRKTFSRTQKIKSFDIPTPTLVHNADGVPKRKAFNRGELRYWHSRGRRRKRLNGGSTTGHDGTTINFSRNRKVMRIARLANGCTHGY